MKTREIKKKTAVDKIRTDMKTQQKQVIRQSKVSEMDYNSFQYEVGMRILEAHMIERTQVNKLSVDKSYWSFFKMLWRNHERALIYYLCEKQEFNWSDYQAKMNEMIESRRTWLSLRQFLQLKNQK